ncbi:MAG TPA: hypothetical protein VGW33_00675 [Terriglobia bacterium]|nr:hypothetical protein [Terriglobia bacterium]
MKRESERVHPLSSTRWRGTAASGGCPESHNSPALSIKLPSVPSGEELFGAAARLHGHLLGRHYRSGLLRGPDAGVRFNLRAWRFVKSAFDFLPWGDDYAFMQTQGYWILANWMLFEAMGDRRYRELAIETTGAVLALQTAEGFWRYPLPERRHLVATVEGNWGAIGLLATYAREPRQEYIEGAVRWYKFLVNRIGFQEHERGEAINYFDRPRGKVPNNSVEAAWFFVRLWKATGENRYLEHVAPLVEFVASVQLASGELPYIVAGPYERARPHYLCFQYNAFQYLKLAWLAAVMPETRVAGILPPLARFLASGVRPVGRLTAAETAATAAADCAHLGGGGPEVDYYTAALAAALHEAARTLRAHDTESGGWSGRLYARLLQRQRADGSFGYSTGDYGLLRDSRSYPRPQVMMLFHLLYGCGLGEGLM